MKTITESIEMLCGRFKRQPTPVYIDKIRNYMTSELRLTLEEIEIVCKRLPEVCKSYPSQAEVYKTAMEVKKNIRKERNRHGQSQIPQALKSKGELIGVPSLIEALCVAIEKGDTEGGAFQSRLERLGLTEDLIWAIYLERCEGKLHPWVVEYKKEKGL